MSDNDDSLTINLALTSAPSSPRVPLTIPKASTSNELRTLAADATKIPLASLKLIFRGRLIALSDDVAVVTEFKLEEACVVHCMGKPVADGSAPAAEATVASGAAAPAASASAGAAVVPPPSTAATPSATTAAATSTPLQSALLKIRSSSTPSTYLTSLQTLSKLLSNIADHPTEEKYRKVKRPNAAFQKRLGGLDGGHDAMLAVGFAVQTDDGVENYVLIPSAEAWPKLVAARAEVEGALVGARAAVSSSSAAAAPTAGAGAAPAMPPFGGMGGMPGGMGGMPGGMPPGMNTPAMQDAVAGMMSDPAALQGMLQNPMIRQMMDRDPRFANNPMLRQQFDTLANDPQAVQQVSTLMSDPTMRSMMQQAAMQQQQQGGGGMGGMGAGGMMGGAGAGAGGGNTGQPGGGMDPAAMAQQMQMLQRMSQQMGGAGAGVGAGGGTGAGGTAGGAPPQQGQQQQGSEGGGGSDSEMTEEEMIAEAIARSLRES